ncbi:GNAT family N-acetyltransferase, partial [Vibrio anguillarum]|nr:GNAT family N-acetyltransferase [Vibrio anguillarum]
MEIKEVNSISGLVDQLNLLLADCINSGASVGFLTPVDENEVKSYWSSVESDLESGTRRVFVAYDGESVI